MNKIGFPITVNPLIPPHTLILGCFPSKESRQKNEYFAHPSNRFWDIAGFALGFDRQLPYATRQKLLTDAGYALWDVYTEAKTEGSLDKHLKSPVASRIREALAEYPSITRLVLNSRNCAKFFIKCFPDWLKETPSKFKFENQIAKKEFAKFVCNDSCLSPTPLSVYICESTSGSNTIKTKLKYDSWLEDCYRSEMIFEEEEKENAPPTKRRRRA